MAERTIRMEKAAQTGSHLNWASLAMEAHMRFIALQDPADNWMVYDQLSEMPAGLSGRVLHGLSREVAEHLTNRENMKFGSKSAFGVSDLGHLALRSNIRPLRNTDRPPKPRLHAPSKSR